PTRRGTSGGASSCPRNDVVKVAVTGSGGLVGGALTRALWLEGNDVIAVPRDHADIGGADAVVHLAGAPIAVRWTARRKREILESRVLGTRRIAKAIATDARAPRGVVCASAIGFYGA